MAARRGQHFFCYSFSVRSVDELSLIALRRIAAGVAHEVNNPLAYVMGNLELIARELDSGRLDVRSLRALVRDAREGAARVRTIVRDLKTFSRAGEPNPFDSSELARAIRRLTG